VDISDIRGESLLLTAISNQLLAFGFCVTGTPAWDSTSFVDRKRLRASGFSTGHPAPALLQNSVWLFANC